MYKILAKTLFLGKQLFYMPTCHSTNDTAMDMLKKHDTQEGCVIITDDQVSGKGQRGNVWHSQPGFNLTFSIILHPRFLAIKDQFYLNMVVSLAIVEVLENILPEDNIKVKWPNDIYVNEKKVAGILIENTLKLSFIEYSVVGIGLNVNQQDFEFNTATSLQMISKQPFDIQGLLNDIVYALEKQYLQLKSGQFDHLKSTYLSHLLGYETERKFLTEYEFKGIIKGISDDGRLIVSERGVNKEFDLKEIRFL